jgi:very-short-patch-repair endonuclease
MEVKLLNGGTIKLRLRNKRFRIDGKSKSKFQYEIGKQLAEKYPHDIIFEEVFIPIENLIFDFFIPSLRLFIEVQGKQHSQYVKYFHRTKRGFHEQNKRDQRKRDLCKLNGFRLIEVYDE